MKIHTRHDSQGRTCIVFPGAGDAYKVVRMQAGPLKVELLPLATLVKEFPVETYAALDGRRLRAFVGKAAAHYFQHAAFVGLTRNALELLTSVHEPEPWLGERLKKMVREG
jgi:hypothetical protein